MYLSASDHHDSRIESTTAPQQSRRALKAHPTKCAAERGVQQWFSDDTNEIWGTNGSCYKWYCRALCFAESRRAQTLDWTFSARLAYSLSARALIVYNYFKVISHLRAHVPSDIIASFNFMRSGANRLVKTHLFASHVRQACVPRK